MSRTEQLTAEHNTHEIKMPVLLRRREHHQTVLQRYVWRDQVYLCVVSPLVAGSEGDCEVVVGVIYYPVLWTLQHL